MNAARDLAGRFFGTASHFERARVAIKFAGPIQPLIIIHDLAGRGEGFECWTDVDVTRLVEGEVLAREGTVVTLGLVDDRNVRCDLLLIDQPVERSC